MRRTLLAALLLGVFIPCAHAGAQDRAREPRRPRMAATADTNSAGAYYSHGVNLLRNRPVEAADAFYWATRIEPGMADAWYARRIALLMSQPERFGSYMQGNRRTVESREMRALDSLHLRALTLNPFFRMKFDKDAFEHWVRWSVRRSNPREHIDEAFLKFAIDDYLRSGGPADRAWVAYAEGRFPAALDLYASALKDSRNPSGIHANRARIFLLLGRPDSALVQMGHAVDRMRERDDRRLVYLYESKALFEHSTGIILEQQGKPSEAREAYGRALQEDLSYYPAHVALASLALNAGDTATALAEMDLAAQIRGADAGVRYVYGQVLAITGRFSDAEQQLRAAVKEEPWYAAPYALLGGVLEKTGQAPQAVESYRAYLARASRNDPVRPRVEERLAALGAAGAP